MSGKPQQEPIWKLRRQRMLAAPSEPWLADRMKRAMLLDYETEEGVAHRSIEARTRADYGGELGNILSLSAGGQVARPPSPVVTEAVRKALDNFHTAHYPGVMGYRDFRVAASEKLAGENGIEADPDLEITPTVGAQLAIDGTIRILVNPGDEVLLVTPEYAAIEPLIHMAGGKVVHVPLIEGEKEWYFDPDELRQRVSNRTKLLMFSNGNNPGGVLYTRNELQIIADLAQEHDFFVFSDEEYEKTVFDGLKHTSIASLPGMKDRTITAFSFSKIYCMSGFRICYMVANPAITDQMYNIIRLAVQAVPSYGMIAATAVLRSDLSDWLEDMMRELTEKRDYAVERLNAMPGVSCAIPRGCYFLFPNLSSYGVPSWQIAHHILKEARVSVAAGHQFGPAGAYHVRVSGNIGLDDLRKGLDRMEQALTTLGKE